MTKPVTGVALMTLWEQGRFGLDEPLAKYLPEYADVKVFAGLDSAGKPVLKTPARPILIRDIMRHTAGFVTDAGPAGPKRSSLRSTRSTSTTRWTSSAASWRPSRSPTIRAPNGATAPRSTSRRGLSRSSAG